MTEFVRKDRDGVRQEIGAGLINTARDQFVFILIVFFLSLIIFILLICWTIFDSLRINKCQRLKKAVMSIPIEKDLLDKGLEEMLGLEPWDWYLIPSPTIWRMLDKKEKEYSAYMVIRIIQTIFSVLVPVFSFYHGFQLISGM
jgi:hypothetical protein